MRLMFNSFDQVHTTYNNVKPLISVHHDRSDDIRPIFKRSRKWERIVRFDDDSFGLTDGNFIGLFNPEFCQHPTPYTPDFERAMVPILWTRDTSTGEQFIRIVNCPEGYVTHSRFKFLAKYLPTNMAFKIGNGKQFVRLPIQSPYPLFQTQRLPKTPLMWDYRAGKPSVPLEEHAFITYRVNPDNTYTRVSDPITVVSDHIDTDAKAEVKPLLDKFYTYILTMASIIDLRNYNNHATYESQLLEYLHKHKTEPVYGRSRSGYTVTQPPESLLREVIANDEHEMYLTLAMYVGYQVGVYDITHPSQYTRTPSQVRANYNAYMNRNLNLYATKEV